MSSDKWTHTTTRAIAKLLQTDGIVICPTTVATILKELGYRLRVNLKSIASGLNNPPAPALRDRQFRYLQEQRARFARHQWPTISVDTKARKLVGRFYQPGRKWGTSAIKVHDHDFPSDAQGVAIPYGIYDLARNAGFVSVGCSYDTAQFAVDSIRMYWRQYGRRWHPHANQMLILADCAGSNGYRTRLWKFVLQQQLCNRYGLTVHVCHYPPGASKWNPVEHRLFSEITKSWAGQPLTSYPLLVRCLRQTKTETGLTVQARLNTKTYRKGRRISQKEMDELNLQNKRVNSQWNYKISPQTGGKM